MEEEGVQECVKVGGVEARLGLRPGRVGYKGIHGISLFILKLLKEPK